MKMKTNIESEIEFWSDVDWKVVNQSVIKLRRRIFDAKREGSVKELRSLQRLMLRSSANFLYSIRKVSYGSGSRTPGIDGETLKSPSDRIRLYKTIVSTGWDGLHPKPIRRIYIQEPTKMRPIGIPTVHDRVIENIICNSLEPEFEAIFEKGSYGFRPKRNTNDAVSRIWLSLTKPTCRKWIVDSDITKCFDSISHKYLLQQLLGFPGLKYIKEILEAGIIVRDVWLSSEDEGTFQGSSLSPLLCNIALHGLESELGVKYDSKGYVNPKGRSLIRFADDLVILCHTKSDAVLALGELSFSLEKRGLKISEAKTKIVHLSEGFDFLGYNIRMCPKSYVSREKAIIKRSEEDYQIIYNKVGTYVSPSRKSVAKVKTKLKEVLLKSKGKTSEYFVKKLNPIILGYVNSKLHWHSNKSFREIDHYVYLLCWRWAIRKHPKKGSGWIKRKYFKNIKLGYINNKWVFTALMSNNRMPNDPKNPFINKSTNPLVRRELYVYKTYWFPIRDYLVGKMDKLPDNRKDTDYFNDLTINRILRKPFNIFRRLDKDLAISQNGICPVCNAELFNEESLHLHHITPRALGGKTSFGNLVYLHMACHYNLRSQYQKDQKGVILMLEQYKKLHPFPKYKEIEGITNEQSENIA